ncbi:alpha-amylase [Pseudobacteriovorax antillogorgiicola]|uniref:Alpha-amylase n=1 Tax=Pseudobacteriovorax antillogorgiicola TaxID=1513793 RepID=A0A1Y6BHF0_9BACT|nr:alpha-amylase family protein [Pseudobacteriovorax antillogorgiicola]TCS57288.1 alpha-amylase [Pseudobacteriovorax antillogorgiicola]SMF03029.1 alpha-amylase [Pseudobacteriovorax antillogorgiicola]
MIVRLLLLLGAVLGLQSEAQAKDPRTAFVHLFEWNWDDIAKECAVIGPMGYAAVQVSPPQESVPGNAWWTRYQPIGYEIVGRSGDRKQFAEMVQECRKHNVDIYVDAVINHMAAGPRNYPAVPYVWNDFHDCFEPIDYGDRGKIQFCDLEGLNDLKTESEYVRDRIANYLNDLVSLGVRGFRIDAAKHIPASDIAAIIDRLPKDIYIFQEVIGAFGEPVSEFEYVGNGDVTEFKYGNVLGSHFKGQSQLKYLRDLRNWQGWLDSSDAIVFTDNHDTQRDRPFSVMSFKDDGARYFIANVFMLAYPYGYPKVMSSFAFEDKDQGRPESGVHSGAECFDGQWICEHRWQGIAAMVKFRNVTSGAFSLDNWWDNGANQIAFSRGDLGFVAINGGSFGMSQRLQTGMPEGTYCNVLSGQRSDFSCSGDRVVVDPSGFADIVLSSTNALAIHRDSKLQSSTEN